MATTHQVITEWNGGQSFTSLVNGHPITMDVDIESGGEDRGPRPKPLLLSALAGCTGIDVVSLLNKMRVPFSDFRIEVQARLTDTIPKVYEQYHILYIIRIAADDRDKMEKAVHLSEEKYCGVSAMLSQSAPVTFEIIYL